MENFWDLDIDNNYVDNTISFLTEQANLLAKQTNNLVIANFCEQRSKIFTPLEMTTAQLTKQLAKPLLMSYDSLSSLKPTDASDLYKSRIYEFYITDKNHKYELTVFKLTCKAVYPIEIKIDHDIATETKLNEKLIIDNEMNFKNTYKKIINSNKVKYIIKKLKELADS